MDGKRLIPISDAAAIRLRIRPEDYPGLLKAVTVEDHIGLIRSPLFDRKEEEALKGLLSVPESFFLRDRFDAIRSNILPVIMEKRRAEKRLRPWSAGCSSGEEPCPLAMLIREAACLAIEPGGTSGPSVIRDLTRDTLQGILKERLP